MDITRCAKLSTVISAVEQATRAAIMDALGDQVARNGGTISKKQLVDFHYGVDAQRLVDQSKGIWNPKNFEFTLSIVSSPDGPYDDEEIEGGLLRYRYRSGSLAGDNLKLRKTAGSGVPIILLRKIETAIYVPVFPVYVVADDPSTASVTVALDEAILFLARDGELDDDSRRYAERITRTRLHQPEFRGRVIVAYDRLCAVCRLRHPELLDAAHIVPDSHVLGRPIVKNGLSLCKIHHAAYDKNLLGIDPDCVVHINRELLEEVDGPMLLHGLQEMNGVSIQLPMKADNRPDPERLEMRFNEFTMAS